MNLSFTYTKSNSHSFKSSVLLNDTDTAKMKSPRSIPVPSPSHLLTIIDYNLEFPLGRRKRFQPPEMDFPDGSGQ